MLSCFTIASKTTKLNINKEETPDLLVCEYENNKNKLTIYKTLSQSFEQKDIHIQLKNHINQLTYTNNRLSKKFTNISNQFEAINPKLETLSTKIFLLKNYYKAKENSLISLDNKLEKYKTQENIKIEKESKKMILLNSLFYQEVSKLRKDHCDQLRQTNAVKNNLKKYENLIVETKEEITYCKNPKLRKQNSNKTDDKVSVLREELNSCKSVINVLKMKCEEYRIKSELHDNENQNLEFELAHKLEFIKYLEKKLEKKS
jgi:hypothetical protein